MGELFEVKQALLSVFPIKVPEDENLRLVAITLMIAESRPEEKDIMVNLVMNFLTMQLVREIYYLMKLANR